MRKKIRTVIDTLTLWEEPWLHARYPDATRKLPGSTRIELVAITEPEMIRPEGAEWGQGLRNNSKQQVLWAGKKHGAVASAYPDGDWWADDTKGTAAATLKLAQQAAEEALADAGKYGFGWKKGITCQPST